MKIVIIGAGGHGKVVADIVQCEKKHQLLGFIDEDEKIEGKIIGGIKVLGNLNSLEKIKPNAAVVAIGENAAREKIYDKLKSKNISLVTVIHPNTTIAKDTKIGSGVMVAAGAIIGPGTTIGNNVIINHSATIDHDNIIEDHVAISPGCHTSGNVTIKKCAFLGTGAIVIPKITIGENAIIGAGAVVICNIHSDVTAVGNPARVIKKH